MPDSMLSDDRTQSLAVEVGPANRRVPHLTSAALLLAVYTLVMVERSTRILFTRGPFLRPVTLNAAEKILFCAAGIAEVYVIVATLAAVLSWLMRHRTAAWDWLPAALAAVAYGTTVTIQYRVLQYFRDGLDLMIVRNLGGGNLASALAYAWSEIAGLAPLLASVIAAVALGTYGLRALHQRGVTFEIRALGPLSFKRLAAANFVVLAGTMAICIWSPGLNRGLAFVPGHGIYSWIGGHLTDWDGDGWSLMDNPRDFAPFDAARHPYALEVPGNGVDEDGVGGDLPAVLPTPDHTAPWNASKLTRRNVILLVLETARADLHDAQVNGEPAMPALRSLPGQQFAMISQTGYTSTSLLSMMNGSLFDGRGPSLIQRFKELGYRTAVFSGQDEAFGGVAAKSHFELADTFVDARSFPARDRLYTSSEPGALAVPHALVNAAFRDWLAAGPQTTPFFVYLNWQELHFPYYFQKEAHDLITNPIPRYKIVADNRDWLLRTYWSGARNVDNALSGLVRNLTQAGKMDNTVLLIVGDHGEEMFENGNLGHGTSIGYEQNAALCKLVNSHGAAPRVPVGSSEVGSILYNALVRSPEDALPLDGETLCYTGSVRQPRELGLVTPQGLIKYSFRSNRWYRQAGSGRPIEPAAPENRLIHLWESLLIRNNGRP